MNREDYTLEVRSTEETLIFSLTSATVCMSEKQENPWEFGVFLADPSCLRSRRL